MRIKLHAERDKYLLDLEKCLSDSLQVRYTCIFFPHANPPKQDQSCFFFLYGKVTKLPTTAVSIIIIIKESSKYLYCHENLMYN
jgi:hypothetical protein